MSNNRLNNSYVVVPQGEYQKLYNKQYAELTILKKKIDPEEKRKNTWKQPKRRIILKFTKT